MKRKKSPNPMNVILTDLKKLAELAVTGSIHAPDFHQELIRKQAMRILSKYVITRRRINGIMKRAGLKKKNAAK